MALRAITTVKLRKQLFNLKEHLHSHWSPYHITCGQRLPVLTLWRKLHEFLLLAYSPHKKGPPALSQGQQISQQMTKRGPSLILKEWPWFMVTIIIITHFNIGIYDSCLYQSKFFNSFTQYRTIVWNKNWWTPRKHFRFATPTPPPPSQDKTA